MSEHTLTYPGNVTGTIVGEVKGPTMFGGFITCLRADYIVDAEHPAGITRAQFLDGVRCVKCGGLLTTADIDPERMVRSIPAGVVVQHDAGQCPPKETK